jgi:hypothetical protein
MATQMQKDTCGLCFHESSQHDSSLRIGTKFGINPPSRLFLCIYSEGKSSGKLRCLIHVGGALNKHTLFGAFATKSCNNAPINFAMSVCPYVTIREQLNGFS